MVMRWPRIADLVGEAKSARTPNGRATIHKRSKTERNALYLETMASSVLATAKEALAVAPALRAVNLVVVRGDRDLSRGGTILATICATKIRRKDLSALDWATVNPAVFLLSLRSTRVHRAGQTKEIVAIGLEHDPRFASGLRQVAENLGWRVPSTTAVAAKAWGTGTRVGERLRQRLGRPSAKEGTDAS